jgi:ubiquitin carboxyl-terminal hydrolase 16/45
MLLKELSTKHEEYADTTQQDAHELLRNLLGGIEMEEVDLIKKVDRPLSSGDASSTVHQSSARMTRSDTPTLARNGEDSEGNEEDSSSDEDSNSDSEPRSSLRPFINTLFGGKLTSVIVCEFGHGKYLRCSKRND